MAMKTLQIRSRVDRDISTKVGLHKIYLLAFTMVFVLNLFSIAFPNILIYERGISASFMGILSTIYAMTYIIGPLAAKPLARRLGIKRTLFISTLASIVSMIAQLFFFHEWVLIISSGIDGIFNSIFWACLEAGIVEWQKISDSKERDQYFRQYGISWNAGGVIAESLGFALLMLGSTDLIASYLSLAVALIQLPIAALIILPIVIRTKQGVQNVRKTYDKPNHKHKRIQKTKPLIIFLPGFIYLGALLYQVPRTMINFVFPYITYTQNIDSSWVYLGIFLQQVMLLMGIALTTHTPLESRAMLFKYSIMSMIGLTFLLWIDPIRFIFHGIIGIGLLAGIIYTISSQALLQYSENQDTLKETSRYQTISALGFGITPLISGWITEYEIKMNFQVLMMFMLIMAIVVTVLELQHQNFFGSQFNITTQMELLSFPSLRNMGNQVILSMDIQPILYKNAILSEIDPNYYRSTIP